MLLTEVRFRRAHRSGLNELARQEIPGSVTKRNWKRMKFYWLSLGILAVWRITYFLRAEDGPWDLVVRVRLAVGNGFWGKLLDCFYCLSLWVSAPFAWWLGESFRERILLWLSFSGGASLLEKLTTPKAPSALYFEEPGAQATHGMLRTETNPDCAEKHSSAPGN
jgi:hypothetical protein